jgi:hypothetical protein
VFGGGAALAALYLPHRVSEDAPSTAVRHGWGCSCLPSTTAPNLLQLDFCAPWVRAQGARPKEYSLYF